MDLKASVLELMTFFSYWVEELPDFFFVNDMFWKGTCNTLQKKLKRTTKYNWLNQQADSEFVFIAVIPEGFTLRFPAIQWWKRNNPCNICVQSKLLDLCQSYIHRKKFMVDGDSAAEIAQHIIPVSLFMDSLWTEGKKKKKRKGNIYERNYWWQIALPTLPVPYTPLTFPYLTAWRKEGWYIIQVTVLTVTQQMSKLFYLQNLQAKHCKQSSGTRTSTSLSCNSWHVCK